MERKQISKDLGFLPSRVLPVSSRQHPLGQVEDGLCSAIIRVYSFLYLKSPFKAAHLQQGCFAFGSRCDCWGVAHHPAALLNEVCPQSGEHRSSPAQAPESRNLVTDGQLLEPGSAGGVLASHSQAPFGGHSSLKITVFSLESGSLGATVNKSKAL